MFGWARPLGAGHIDRHAPLGSGHVVLLFGFQNMVTLSEYAQQMETWAVIAGAFGPP